MLEPQGPATGTLTLTFADTVANQPLTSTTAAGATINVEGQWEDHTFNATEGDQVTFRASNFNLTNGASGGGSQVYLVFYEPNGSLCGNLPPLGCYFTALGGSCTISPPGGGSGTRFAFLEPAGPAVGRKLLWARPPAGFPGLLCGWRAGEGVEFGEQVRGLGRADQLEYLQCLPQQDPGLDGVAGGQGAAAQAGQCVSLVPGAGDGAGQVQGLLMAPLSLREVTADPV